MERNILQYILYSSRTAYTLRDILYYSMDLDNFANGPIIGDHLDYIYKCCKLLGSFIYTFYFRVAFDQPYASILLVCSLAGECSTGTPWGKQALLA